VGLGLEKPNLGLDPGETSALAISIAPSPNFAKSRSRYRQERLSSRFTALLLMMYRSNSNPTVFAKIQKTLMNYFMPYLRGENFVERNL
jgi:hypothetical protein